MLDFLFVTLSNLTETKIYDQRTIVCLVMCPHGISERDHIWNGDHFTCN